MASLFYPSLIMEKMVKCAIPAIGQGGAQPLNGISINAWTFMDFPISPRKNGMKCPLNVPTGKFSTCFLKGFQVKKALFHNFFEKVVIFMAFFVIASLWLSFLGIVGFVLSVGILYMIYRLDGGKLRFIPWYRAMRF